MHRLRECHIVQIEAVHDVEVTVARQKLGGALVDHGFHVGRHHRKAEAAPAKFDARIALTPAAHDAAAWQQEDVVVVEYFHVIPLLRCDYTDTVTQTL